jgi:phage terminase small subunit
MMQELTSRQRKAIAALLSCRTVAQAAQLSGVSERTLYRWLADDTFRAAVLSAEGETINQATRRLLGLQQAAIDTLGGILQDDSAPAGVRVRAAESVLDLLLRLRDLRDVEDRLARLEQQLHENENDQGQTEPA